MKLADLKLNPDNPRNIKPEKLDKLAQSIKDFPKMMLKRPIVYDENKIIIGGNMRYKAIEKLGMTEIPDEWTSDASDFTPEERKRFIMQDNAEMGEHDWDMVANQYELEDLDAWGIDVPYADTTEVEEDEAPEISSEPPVSKLGEIYQLGRHRVMCGDSTDPNQIQKLMSGSIASFVFTDPPYGVSYQSNMRTESEKFDVLEGDDAIDIAGIAAASVYSEGWMLVCTSWKVLKDWLNELEHWGSPNNIIIWDKGGGGIGDLRHSLLTDYEVILAWNRGAEIVGKRIGSVWDVGKDHAGDYEHPTQKPVGLPALAINTFTHKGDSVLDVYLGSGSTLIACEQTDRTCYGMELDPKYVDVIRKRYAKFTAPDNQLPENWEELTPTIKGE